MRLQKPKFISISFLIAFLINGLTLNIIYAIDEAVKNPSFEIELSGKPESWEEAAWNNSQSAVEYKLESGTYYSGTRSISINNIVANDSRIIQNVKVEANTIYRVSCWVKTENVGMDAKGANISIDGSMESSRDIKGTIGTWELLEVYLKVNSGTDIARLTIGIGGYGSLNTGKAYFDDVSVTKVDSIPGNTPVIELGTNTNAGSNTDENKRKKTVNTIPGPGKALWILIAIAGVILVMIVTYCIFLTSRSKKEPQ